jgi:hypothetical protein
MGNRKLPAWQIPDRDVKKIADLFDPQQWLRSKIFSVYTVDPGNLLIETYNKI